MQKKKIIFGFLLGVTFNVSQVFANMPVIDMSNLLQSIESAYTSYEHLLVGYNSIKTQYEQFQKQVEAMKSLDEKIKDAKDSLSNMKDAFKDLNSFENLTNLQKVEASRRALRKAVRKTSDITKSYEDLGISAMTRTFTTSDGRQYSIGSLFGIPGFDRRGGTLTDLKLNFKKGWDAFTEKERIAFTGNMTEDEKRKIARLYGLPAWQVALERDVEEKLAEQKLGIAVYMDSENFGAEAGENDAIQQALATGIEEAGNSQIEQQQVSTLAQIAVYKAQVKQYEADIRWHNYQMMKDEADRDREKLKEAKEQLDAALKRKQTVEDNSYQNRRAIYY